MTAPRSDSMSVTEPSKERFGTMGGRRFALILAGITVVGFAIRLFYIVRVSSKQHFGGDPLYYYYWPAVQLAHGHGYLDFTSVMYQYPLPEANHAPGFVVILAALYRMGLHLPNEMRVAMSVIGMLSVVLVGICVKRVVSDRAGLLAALLAALYPNFWISDTLLLSETIMVLGYVTALVGLYSFHVARRWHWIVLASLGLTLAASARPENLVLFPMVFVPMIWARADLAMQRRVGLLALAAIAPVMVFGAWTVRNEGLFAKRVVLTTGSGQTMQVGTCPATFSGPLIGMYSLSCGQVFANGTGSPTAPPLSAAEMANYRKRLMVTAAWYDRHGTAPEVSLPLKTPPLGKRKDQSVDNAYFTHRTVRFLETHKSEVPAVVLVREARTVGLWNPHQQNLQDQAESRGKPAFIRWSQLAFWMLVPFALAGAWVWRRRRIPLYPILAQVFLVAGVAAITFGLTRYRAPVEVGIVMLAATAIDVGVDRIGSIRDRWRADRLGTPETSATTH